MSVTVGSFVEVGAIWVELGVNVDIRDGSLCVSSRPNLLCTRDARYSSAGLHLLFIKSLDSG